MKSSNITSSRAEQVAYQLNADLPQNIQNQIHAEEERVAKDILAKRGLAERKILLVGGAGYIGSVLTAHLLQNGYQVRCLDRLLYKNEICVLPYVNHAHYEFMQGDLCQTSSIEKSLADVTDVVILAGLVGDPITKKYPEDSDKINDQGLAHFIDCLNGRQLNKLIFISTCSNYGLISEDQLADENFVLSPLSLYAKAKVKIEAQLMALKDKVDYHATVLRFATAFGMSPRMRFDLTVNEFTREMFLKNDLLVYDGHTWRPYCHVQDFSRLIERVLEFPVEQVSFDVFNAGGEANNCTKQMIVDKILKQIPDAPVAYKKHGTDPRNYRVDFSKVKSRLLFEPQFSVEDGVQKIIVGLEQGLFRRVDENIDFFGNYNLYY